MMFVLGAALLLLLVGLYFFASRKAAIDQAQASSIPKAEGIAHPMDPLLIEKGTVAARFFIDWQANFPGEYGEIFMTNIHGALVASTGRFDPHDDWDSTKQLVRGEGLVVVEEGVEPLSTRVSYQIVREMNEYAPGSSIFPVLPNDTG